MRSYIKFIGKIVHYWKRLEFQGRGYAHSHNLYWPEEDEIAVDAIESDDPVKQQPLFQLASEVMTCKLLPRQEGDDSDLNNVALTDGTKFLYREKELEYEYNVENKFIYFKDEAHPSRERFICDGRDFSYRERDGGCKDQVVLRKLRRWQLAQQMHKCVDSCWKYCKEAAKKKRKCRYHFMKPQLVGNDFNTVSFERRSKNLNLKSGVRLNPGCALEVREDQRLRKLFRIFFFF